jgi:hypothetical protein
MSYSVLKNELIVNIELDGDGIDTPVVVVCKVIHKFNI